MRAHAATVLLPKRPILAEKVARRGFHLRSEYAIDPLEILFVREVMRYPSGGISPSASVGDVHSMACENPRHEGNIFILCSMRTMG
jgi:hypothetical protein